MNPQDVDDAAKDVRQAVEEAVVRALEPYRLKSVVFLQVEAIADNVGELAERCVRTLPRRLSIEITE